MHFVDFARIFVDFETLDQFLSIWLKLNRFWGLWAFGKFEQFFILTDFGILHRYAVKSPQNYVFVALRELLFSCSWYIILDAF